MNTLKPKIKKIKDPNFWDVNDVAKLLKMSKSHVYSLTSLKQIPHIKLLNKKLLFEKTEVIKWLNSKKVSAK
jgi:excisionase family DNA binding protein